MSGSSAPRWRQPAEWTHHDAVWLAWPHLQEEWGNYFRPAQHATAELARAIAAPDASGTPRGERIELLVPPHHDHDAIAAEVAGSGARLRPMRYGDVWLRDTAPVFVTGPEGLAASCFRFNGWGEKYLLDGDAEVAGCIAEIAGIPARRLDLVLEGGAIEVDGAGTIMTTRQCLLSPKRNPGLAEAAIELRLREAFGGDHVIWLERGLANDHTDGHIDTLARFVAPGVVLCMEPAGPSDPNRDVLLDIVRDLRAARDAAGNPLEVVTVPSPGRVANGGELLAASYLNFYIGNRVVVVPVYGSPQDDEAVGVVRALFPDREVVGLDAYPVVTGGGAFHCVSQQQPAVRA